MSDVLRIERNGALLRLTMTRPEKRNALNSELVEALDWALVDADADDGIQVIMLAAQGPVYCAGADIKEFAGRTDDTSTLSAKRSAGMGRLFQMSQVKTKPVIAVVDGPALGGGAALAVQLQLPLPRLLQEAFAVLDSTSPRSLDPRGHTLPFALLFHHLLLLLLNPLFFQTQLLLLC